MRQSILFVAAGFLALAACQREVLDPQTESKPEADLSNASTVEIIAGDAGTRTEITEVSSGSGSDFALSWSKGDQVDLLEMIYEYFPGGGTGEPDPYVIYESNPLSSATETATFTVDLYERIVPENPTYHYVGVYPAGHIYGARQYGDHARLDLYFPDEQRPSAISFDPEADLLVSNIRTTKQRMSGTVQMQFARVGTIVKMTLKGLAPGAKITRGAFKTDPDDWASDYLVAYDPVTKGLEYTKSEGILNFYPKDVVANDEGEADIWLRTRSGTISSWLSVDITAVLDNSEIKYVKEIDLRSANRTITLKNGGLTSFGVTMNRYYSLEHYSSSFTTTATSIEGHMWLNTGGAPVESTEFGLIKVAGSNVQDYTYENAAEGDIIPMTVSRTSGTYVYLDVMIENLVPDTQYRLRPYMKMEDGTVYYIPNGFCFGPRTKEQIVFDTPELVDLGLPSGTKWASFNLGSSSTLSAGRFFAFGETEPAETYRFTTYGNKYWTSIYAGSGVRYVASKYSTDYRNATSLDFLTELEPEDDAATVNLGQGWRTPSYFDFKELMENCTPTNNSDGSVTYTSTINGASITLPACGYYLYTGGSASYSTFVSSQSYYMTSSLYIPMSTTSVPYDENYGFRNQPMLFWQGFYEKMPFYYESYYSRMFRSGYYNIRPVYGEKPDTDIPIVRLAGDPVYSDWSSIGGSITFEATFENLDQNANPVNDYRYYIRFIYGEGGVKRSSNAGYVTEGSSVTMSIGYDIVGYSEPPYYYQAVLKDLRNNTYYFSEIRETTPPSGD